MWGNKKLSRELAPVSYCHTTKQAHIRIRSMIKICQGIRCTQSQQCFDCATIDHTTCCTTCQIAKLRKWKNDLDHQIQSRYKGIVLRWDNQNIDSTWGTLVANLSSIVYLHQVHHFSLYILSLCKTVFMFIGSVTTLKHGYPCCEYVRNGGCFWCKCTSTLYVI